MAELELDERFSADVRSLRMHPALLDMATGGSLYLTEDYEHSDDLYLPISYKKISVYRSIPASFFSHIRSRQVNPVRNEVETFDITLFNEQGDVLAEIEGFAMRRIADFEKALEENRLGSHASRSAAEQPIEIVEWPGIPPLEGARGSYAHSARGNSNSCSRRRSTTGAVGRRQPSAVDTGNSCHECCRTFRGRNGR